jgi:hypothetical protein
MIESINVGVSSWIIQDGNYEDFIAGRRYRFALEFYAEQGLRPAKAGATIQLAQREAEQYHLTGRVAFLAPNVWVIDAGIQLFREDQAPKVRIGDVVHGSVHIGIDPFFYMEYLKDTPGIPNLFYEFEVTGVLLETTPWVTSSGVTQRQAGSRTFRRVDRTDAESDDGGNAHYILESRIVGPAAL